MTEPLRAAVVGLGNVAWKFDCEPGRKVIWTHVGAYESLAPRIALVGASDIDDGIRRQFAARYPYICIFENVESMMSATAPHIVSICTPPAAHRAAIEHALHSPSVKVIWCEKPLATSLDDALAIIEACEERGAVLIVNHVRRWSPLWQLVKKRIMAGEVGTVRHIRISMPNRLWSVGSHAVDLALMLGGPVGQVVSIDIPSLREDDEPARPALMVFKSGTYGTIEVTGLKDRLLVEAEIIGDHGRLLAREDKGEIKFEPFVPSREYAQYLQLGPYTIQSAATLSDVSPFVVVAEEAVGLALDPLRHQTCSGREALETMRILNMLAA